MQLENFKFEPSLTEINFQEQHLDLHNCYTFIGIKHSLDSKIAWLAYRKLDEEFVPIEYPKGLCFLFKNVSRIYKKKADYDYPPEHLEQDNNCPDLMGYSYEGDSIMEGPANHLNLNEEFKSLIFTFVTGRSIKVEAETVELVAVENTIP